MPFTAEDLQQLGEFVDAKVRAAVGEATAPPAPPPDDPAVAVTKEAAPYYYVHLADGKVLESQDSASTHMDVDGILVPVIGRYLRDATPPVV